MIKKTLVFLTPLVILAIYSIFVFLYLTKTSDTGVFCGGFANVQCNNGATCIINDKYPDAGGTCYEKTGSINNVLTNPFIVFSLQKTSDETDTSKKVLKLADIYANKSQYEGKTVTIQAYVRKGNIACTKMGCGEENKCCNSCSGSLLLDDMSEEGAAISDRDIGIASLLDQKGELLLCTGNECGQSCPAPFEEEGFYEVEGKIMIAKENSYSRFDVQVMVLKAKRIK